MSRRMVSFSKIFAWVAIGLSVAVVLVWFILPIVVGLQTRDPSEDAFATVLLRSALFGGGLLVSFQFLPLYAADVFLWFVARGRLQSEACRGFRLVVCAVGLVVSAGTVLWYVWDAVLLFGGVFI